MRRVALQMENALITLAMERTANAGQFAAPVSADLRRRSRFALRIPLKKVPRRPLRPREGAISHATLRTSPHCVTTSLQASEPTCTHVRRYSEIAVQELVCPHAGSGDKHLTSV